MTDSLTYRISLRTPQRRLLDAAQQGDRAALLELVRAYEPLVQRVVWRLRLPLGCEREDLAQEARVGLLTAIRAWRPERGPFPAFADRCVTNQALLALQAAARQKHQVLSRAMHLEAGAGGRHNAEESAPALSLHDMLAAPRDARIDPEARLLVREQLESVLQALPTLTPNEQIVLTGALNGQSYQQLAPRIGGTTHAAVQAAYRARRKLAAAVPRAA